MLPKHISHYFLIYLILVHIVFKLNLQPSKFWFGLRRVMHIGAFQTDRCSYIGRFMKMGGDQTVNISNQTVNIQTIASYTQYNRKNNLGFNFAMFWPV